MNYDLIVKQVKALCGNKSHFVANLSNISALLNEALPDINWVGFYLVEDNNLVLGPFQGRVACVEIKCGSGVCGTALLKKETILVKNVHEFPGHIACDSRSNSEIVIPIFKGEKVVAELDIDSEKFERFTEEDKIGLEKVCKAIENVVF